MATEKLTNYTRSVNYNKESEIFSHYLTYFPRLNKKTETKEHIKLHLFYHKKGTFFLKLSLLLIIFSDTKTELTLVTTEYNCTESVQILRIWLYLSS